MKYIVIDMPKYIELAHWLYKENRMVPLTEVAKLMNVTLSGVHHYIKSIRKYEEIFQVRISQVDVSERKQYAISVLSIRPYKLISGRRPVIDNSASGVTNRSSAMTTSEIWIRLVSKPWREVQLVV